MIAVTEDQFKEFLAKHPLALPDGFKLVGEFTQTKWIENHKEIARETWNVRGCIYEIVNFN